MISVPPGMRVYLASGHVDMRKGMQGLSASVQMDFGQDPFAGHLFVFRGHAYGVRSARRGDLIKILAWDGQGFCLFSKRLERGRFIWPRAEGGVISLTSAQLSMLLEGIDWRMPQRTWRPETVE
ncbi:MAG: IS66 family insertion sequence element accessory protein TnpB [Rhodospirillum sp.]|nr:IS66 family insertion sequence element accessory protein TnpB [Rhodospirillum sp.]MCF8491434.1 IS66 family insertion sequence element accessory protein TnpB [Rhodospirillum sp.]MCF8500938.1 IS66 family insertion sequence element accessory protein TnpB [Rhodospirillum sp.]